MQFLSISGISCFQDCPREFCYSRELNLSPKNEAQALSFGKAIHGFLELWWRGERLEPIRVSDLFERERASAVAAAYHERWIDDTNYECLGTEVPFEIPLINPSTGRPSTLFRVRGKLDALIESKRGIEIVEHKTSSEEIGPGSNYWKALQLDGQVSLYYQGARGLGYPPVGCLYDVLGKPAIRPLKATPPDARKYTKAGVLYANQRDRDETPEEFGARCLNAIAESPDNYFQRGRVVRLESEEREFAHDIWAVAHQIRDCQRSGVWPKRTRSCKKLGGGLCGYFDLCAGLATRESYDQREEH
jgi:hypothetical protein